MTSVDEQMDDQSMSLEVTETHETTDETTDEAQDADETSIETDNAADLTEISNLNLAPASRQHGYLHSLALKYGTDKADQHHTYKGLSYCDIYERHFDPYRHSVRRFVEIGIKDGSSLRMWEEYFPNAEIIGIDIDPRCAKHSGGRIKCIIGDQNDLGFLSQLRDSMGEYDILLDDGSHITNHQINTFNILHPICAPGGMYIIEDLRNSYEEFLNHHDLRAIWPGMKYNDPRDALKNYRAEFNRFLEHHTKMLDFHSHPSLLAIHTYPMTIVFENA